MKKFSIVAFCFLFSMMLVSNTCQASDWRFPLGLSYISGMSDVADLYESNIEAEGYIVDILWQVPIGLSFQPYVQLENGLRFGGGIGPISVILIEDYDFYDLPININAGYTFLPEADASPYVRFGLSYHAAGGDYVESVSPGYIAGVGVDFNRNDPVGFGIDFTYDTCEIEFEHYSGYYYGLYPYEPTVDIKAYEYIISFFIRF